MNIQNVILEKPAMLPTQTFALAYPWFCMRYDFTLSLYARVDLGDWMRFVVQPQWVAVLSATDGERTRSTVQSKQLCHRRHALCARWDNTVGVFFSNYPNSVQASDWTFYSVKMGKHRHHRAVTKSKSTITDLVVSNLQLLD